MSMCEHSFVFYIGDQETLTKGKFLKLYQCIECGSTITLGKKSKSKILKNKTLGINNLLLTK